MWNNPLPLIEKGKYLKLDNKPILTRKKHGYKISNKAKAKYYLHPYDNIGWYDEIIDRELNEDKPSNNKESEIDKQHSNNFTTDIVNYKNHDNQHNHEQYHHHHHHSQDNNQSNHNHQHKYEHQHSDDCHHSNDHTNNHHYTNMQINDYHKCEANHKTKHCKICGILMNKDYYFDGYIIPAMDIIYPENICNKEEMKGISILNIKKPCNIEEMREYLLYNMDTKYNSLNDNYKNRGLIPKNIKKLLTTRTIKNIDDEDVLKFDSNFESGNLSQVYYVNDNEYDLYLNVDTNTHGNTQWFFFSVATDELPSSSSKNKKVVFNIKNCYKPESLFNYGMKIMIYSYKENEINNVGWEQGGEEIKYSFNSLKREALVLINNSQNDNTKKPKIYDIEDEIEFEMSKYLNNNIKNNDTNNNNGYDINQEIVTLKNIYKRDRSFTCYSTNAAGTTATTTTTSNGSAANKTHNNNNNNNNGHSNNHHQRILTHSENRNERSVSTKKGSNSYSIKKHKITNNHKTQVASTNINLNNNNNQQQQNRKNSFMFTSYQHQQQQQFFKKKKVPYYTLSFNYTFKHEYDKVLFAYCMPYTFSDMINCLQNIENALRANLDPNEKIDGIACGDQFLTINNESEQNTTQFETIVINTQEIHYKRERLCDTLAGLPLYIITITSNIAKSYATKPKRRKGIFITARIHPGEANSSFVMQGILKYLTGNTEEAKSLRSFFIFKIVPMMNPDGVAFGNNRTSLSGYDLNRRWLNPNEKLQPTVYYTKQAIANFQKEREILIFCDLHGHSKKKNSFIYGCNTAADGGFCSWTKVRLFPRIYAKRSVMFSLKDCKFRITPDKLGTARVVVWKEFKVTNSFTLETSFFGYECGDKIEPFTPNNLEKLGISFLLSILEYIYVLADLTKELFLTNGWLKPSKLIEVTGKPAAEQLALKLKEEKEEERKKLRLEKLLAEKEELILQHKRHRKLKIMNFPNGQIIEGPQVILTSPGNQAPVNALTMNARFIQETESIEQDERSNIEYHKPILIKKNSSTESPEISLQQEEIHLEKSPTIHQNLDVQIQMSHNKNLSISGQCLDLSLFKHQAKSDNKRKNSNPSSPCDLGEEKQLYSKVGYSLESSEEELNGIARICYTKVKAEEAEYVDSIIANEPAIKGLLPGYKEYWREYFDTDELQNNYELIMKGQDPNDYEEISEADSDSADENIQNEDDLKNILLKNIARQKKPTKPIDKPYQLLTKNSIKERISQSLKIKTKDHNNNTASSNKYQISSYIRSHEISNNKGLKNDKNNISLISSTHRRPNYSEDNTNNNQVPTQQHNTNILTNATTNSHYSPENNTVTQKTYINPQIKNATKFKNHFRNSDDTKLYVAKSLETKNPLILRLEEFRHTTKDNLNHYHIKQSALMSPIKKFSIKYNDNSCNINLIPKPDDSNIAMKSSEIHNTSEIYVNSDINQHNDKSPYLKINTVQDTLQKNISNILAKASVNFTPFNLNGISNNNNNIDRGRSKLRGQKDFVWISPLELRYSQYKNDETFRRHKMFTQMNENSFIHVNQQITNDSLIHENQAKDHIKETNKEHTSKDYLNLVDYENEFSMSNCNIFVDNTLMNKFKCNQIPNIKKMEIHERKLKDHQLKPITMCIDNTKS